MVDINLSMGVIWASVACLFPQTILVMTSLVPIIKDPWSATTVPTVGGNAFIKYSKYMRDNVKQWLENATTISEMYCFICLALFSVLVVLLRITNLLLLHTTLIFLTHQNIQKILIRKFQHHSYIYHGLFLSNYKPTSSQFVLKSIFKIFISPHDQGDHGSPQILLHFIICQLPCGR